MYIRKKVPTTGTGLRARHLRLLLLQLFPEIYKQVLKAGKSYILGTIDARCR